MRNVPESFVLQMQARVVSQIQLAFYVCVCMFGVACKSKEVVRADPKAAARASQGPESRPHMPPMSPRRDTFARPGLRTPAPESSAVNGRGGCRVRLMAANITSGDAQSYEEPGVHIFKALAPDVVMLQEFNVRGQTLDTFVRGTFGAEYTYFVEHDSSIPNGVVSRFPMLASGEWHSSAPNANRDYAWARINVPGPRNLLVVSVHLRTKGGPRAIEEREIVEYMRGALKPDDIAVLGGDFNHDAQASPSLAGARSFLALSSPLPTNMDGRTTTSANLSKTLDHLFVGDALQRTERAITMDGRDYPHGLVFTSDMAAPAEIAPVLPRDSFATSMQHMPVVRDFDLCEAP